MKLKTLFLIFASYLSRGIKIKKQKRCFLFLVFNVPFGLTLEARIANKKSCKNEIEAKRKRLSKKLTLENFFRIYFNIIQKKKIRLQNRLQFPLRKFLKYSVRFLNRFFYFSFLSTFLLLFFFNHFYNYFFFLPFSCFYFRFFYFPILQLFYTAFVDCTFCIFSGGERP